MGLSYEALEQKDEKESIEYLIDLSLVEIEALESCIIELKKSINKKKYKDSIRYCEWLKSKLDINLLASEQDEHRSKDREKMHPTRPRRGEIYLTQLGENIGKEINDKHLVLIVQNNKGNSYGNTVVCIPISSSTKLYPPHEKIELKDIKSGRLDKLPSKAKTEQIHYLDKARLIHKVAELEPKARASSGRKSLPLAKVPGTARLLWKAKHIKTSHK